MRRVLKSTFLAAQRQFGRAGTRSGMFRPSTSSIPVFLLHSLSPAVSDTSLRPDNFRELLTALLQAGFECIALTDFLHRKQFDKPAFVITFDDGYFNNLEPGIRILEELNLTATLFVATGFIDRAISPPWHSSTPNLVAEFRGANQSDFRPMDWAQVREAAASARMDIGSHTMTHRMTGNLPEERMRQEIAGSKHRLEDKLGQSVNLFAYPYGVRRYGAYSELSERLVREAGYACSCTSEIGRARPEAGGYLLPRIPMVNADRPADIVAKACGGYDWVAGAQAAYQKVFSNPHGS